MKQQKFVKSDEHIISINGKLQRILSRLNKKEIQINGLMDQEFSDYVQNVSLHG